MTSLTRVQSQASTPAPSAHSSRDDIDDSGSEFAAGDHPDGQGHHDSMNGDGVVENETLANVKRKRGGQKGKRKLRDMHLALDGPALIAFGESTICLRDRAQLTMK